MYILSETRPCRNYIAAVRPTSIVLRSQLHNYGEPGPQVAGWPPAAPGFWRTVIKRGIKSVQSAIDIINHTALLLLDGQHGS
jgi:hypothetical protein